MSTPNFVAITAANCPPAKRAAALADMASFAGDCREHGAERVTFGSVISGRFPGALVFVQFFSGLDKFESVVNNMPHSDAYKRLLDDHEVTPFARNVLKAKPIDFEPTLEPMPNYLMLTRAHRHAFDEPEMINLMNKVAPVFKSAGAQTMRMGQTLTGSDLGTYMLGVTYPDMSAIERTYQALGENSDFATLMNGMDVDMRSISRIAGIL